MVHKMIKYGKEKKYDAKKLRYRADKNMKYEI